MTGSGCKERFRADTANQIFSEYLDTLQINGRISEISSTYSGFRKYRTPEMKGVLSLIVNDSKGRKNMTIKKGQRNHQPIFFWLLR